MYEGIYLVFIRSLCIFVDILTVIRSFIFFNINYEYNITLMYYVSMLYVYPYVRLRFSEMLLI